MHPRILLVNPPIYDFTAYDYWLKPYGLLRVAGHLRGRTELHLFDYLDRCHPQMRDGPSPLRVDRWGRGPFRAEIATKPPIFAPLARHYRRFGLPRTLFKRFLADHPPFDVALVQTVMTYWYPGVCEVIEDLRTRSPDTAIVLGGPYATLCPAHARTLGADLVVEGVDLRPLWEFLGLEPATAPLPYWEGYSRLETGVVKLTDGCPFRCTYCSVPQVYPPFRGDVERALAEIDFLHSRKVRRFAFYDDALLFRHDRLLQPLLESLIRRAIDVELHTPNALNARFITAELARLMVRAGFRTFHLGFESRAVEWQKRTGGKVYADELESAIGHLQAAGARADQLTAYLLLGHPAASLQEVEASMHFAHAQGIRIMLAEFSPIPGTPDGEQCRQWVDLDEPLWHNKTAFPLVALGADAVKQLKELALRLNRTLPSPP